MKKLRKKKLINSKFQLKMTFSALGASLILTFLILSGIGLFTAMNMQDVSSRLAGLEKSVETQDNLIEAYVRYAESMGHSVFNLNTEEMKRDHKASMDEVKTTVAYLKETAERNMYLVVVIIGAVFLHSVLFVIFFINLTHRIAGPIFVMNRVLDDLIEGKDVSMYSLREGDHFADLYEKIRIIKDKMVKGDSQG